MDLFIDYPDDSVNVQSVKQIDKDSPESLREQLREYREKIGNDPGFRTNGINNSDPLALTSGHGGASPGVFGAIVPSGWYPTKPGASQHRDMGPVTRDEFSGLEERVRAQGVDAEEIASAVAAMRAERGAR